MLQKTGKPKEAIFHYLQAITNKPDYAIAHNNLGTVLAQGGNLEKAVFHFKQAVKFKPDFMNAQQNLSFGLKHLELKRKKESSQ